MAAARAASACTILGEEDEVGYDAIERRTDARLSTLSRLIYEIVTERGELHPAEKDRQFDPSAMGALRGSTFRVQLPPWLREQLAAGATFLGAGARLHPQTARRPQSEALLVLASPRGAVSTAT